MRRKLRARKIRERNYLFKTMTPVEKSGVYKLLNKILSENPKIKQAVDTSRLWRNQYKKSYTLRKKIFSPNNPVKKRIPQPVKLSYPLRGMRTGERARQYYERTKEKRREHNRAYQKRYREQHPEFAERMRIYHQEKYKSDPIWREKMLLKQKLKYRLHHPLKVRESYDRKAGYFPTQKGEIIDLLARYRRGAKVRTWDVHQLKDNKYILKHRLKGMVVLFDANTRKILKRVPPAHIQLRRKP